MATSILDPLPPSQHTYGTLSSLEADVERTTPMFRQYLEVKAQYPGVLLLYQMGDFFETFLEDAITIARALELTLTAREAGQLGKVPMAGVPLKAAPNYISRLLGLGYKLALCEQTEDPAQAKGLVQRRVVRVLSAGTVTDTQHLSADQPNYLSALALSGKVSDWDQPDGCALATVDLSTGRVEVVLTHFAGVMSELERLRPAELLVPGRVEKQPHVAKWTQLVADVPPAVVRMATCTPVSREAYQLDRAERALCQTYQLATLDGFPLEEGLLRQACGVLAQYIRDSFLDQPPILQPPRRHRMEQVVYLNAAARRHLELVATARDGKKEGSLYGVLNQTATTMGARLLREWINAPLTDLAAINARLDGVEVLTTTPLIRQNVRTQLATLYDLERLAQKAATGTLNPRELLALGQSLQRLPGLVESLQEIASTGGACLSCWQTLPPLVTQLPDEIIATLHPEPPVGLKEGQLIRPGVDPQIDHLRHRLETQAQWLTDFERTQREETGLKTLKVSFTSASGYYIELGKATARQAPAHYQRRQTLTNSERFITPELKAFEEEILSAQGLLYELETERFLSLREVIRPHAPWLAQLAGQVATLDVLQSLAQVAVARQYVRPVLDAGDMVVLQQARHPVLEAMLPMGRFVANDCAVSMAVQTPWQSDDTVPQVQIITGPNMAGKSTYMRQVVLCVLMAQMGSFVPAAAARIGLVDAVYTRIGAVDDLSQGQSTFMVEMAETAQMLHGATARSLVVLDEIGRGTSTYDGVAIAWAVVDYLVRRIGCRTLFATHYHELNVLELLHPHRVANVRACVSERDGEVAFLHRIEPGSAQKSYGIQVARMAGLPAEVLQVADARLADLQADADRTLRQRRSTLTRREQGDPQLRLFE